MDLVDPSAWEGAIRPNTRLLFAETPSNPITEIADIAALARLAQDCGSGGAGPCPILTSFEL